MSPASDISIGVVVPAYRSASTIVATLDAISSQTVSPADAIVVVDGLDGATQAAARSHASGIEVVVLPENTGGPAGPRNLGAALLRARTRLDAIWFLDADDVPDPRFVEVTRDLLHRHPAADLVATRFRQWRTGDPPPPRDEVLDRPARGIDLDWYLEHTGSLLPSFSVLRTGMLDRLRDDGPPFAVDLRVNQDYDVFVRTIHLGEAVRTAWSGGAYRVHDAGISANGVGTWLCRLVANGQLERWFESRGEVLLADRFRRASGSALRSAARHLWRRGRSGDRETSVRLLLDDLAQNRDPRSFLVLITLFLGIDRRAKSLARGDDRLGTSD